MARPKSQKTQIVNLEDLVEKTSLDKDKDVFADIYQSLPSGAQVRIFKLESGKRELIEPVEAEILRNTDPYQFIKDKYVKDYGEGDYILEFVDSTGQTISTRAISIAPKTDSAQKEIKEKEFVLKQFEKAAEYQRKAMEDREKVFEKIKEAEEEKRKAETEKFEIYIESLKKQWETIENMYKEQIETLKSYIEQSGSPSETILLQMQLDKITRDFENAKRDFELKIKEAYEKKETSDKLYDLVSQLMPTIINKLTKTEDPVHTFSKFVDAVKSIVGERKDIIQEILDSPAKLETVKRVLGVVEEKPDLLNSLLQNPETIKTIKEYVLNRKSFLEEIFENPEKLKTIKELLGLDKKDFLTELIENPKRYEILKKILGVEDTEKTLKSMIETFDKGLKHFSSSLRPVKEPKEPIDELIEYLDKFNKIKGFLQPSQPARTFMELISQVLEKVAPAIAQGIQAYVNGLVTVEAIRRGYLHPAQLMQTQAQVPFEGMNYKTQPQAGIQIQPRITQRQKKQQIQQTGQKPRKANYNLAWWQIINSAKKKATIEGNGGIDEEAFVSELKQKVKRTLERNPHIDVERFKETGKQVMGQIMPEKVEVIEQIFS